MCGAITPFNPAVLLDDDGLPGPSADVKKPSIWSFNLSLSAS
jgi:hypothetical protein